jgi:hypothetical protein
VLYPQLLAESMGGYGQAAHLIKKGGIKAVVSQGSEGRGVAVVIVVPAYFSKCDDSRSACECCQEGGQANSSM